MVVENESLSLISAKHKLRSHFQWEMLVPVTITMSPRMPVVVVCLLLYWHLNTDDVMMY